MKYVLKDENKSLERREVWWPVSLKCWFLAPHEALWCGEGFSLLASKRHSPYTQRNSIFSGSDLPANSRVVQNSGLFRGYHETCPPCWLKKPAQCQSCDFSFIWEQIEDCNPGDSTSDDSERLLQISLSDTPKRQLGKVRICVILGEGGDCAIRHVFSPGIFY